MSEVVLFLSETMGGGAMGNAKGGDSGLDLCEGRGELAVGCLCVVFLKGERRKIRSPGRRR